MFFKPKSIEVLTKEHLYECKRALLLAEADLERATAAVDALRARARRLEQSECNFKFPDLSGVL